MPPPNLPKPDLSSQFSRQFRDFWNSQPQGVSKEVLNQWNKLGPLEFSESTEPFVFEQKLDFGKSVDAIGGTYEGQINFNNEPHGLGRYVTKTGEIYEGQWKFSEENGFGRRIWNSGEYYIGMWKDFKFDGPGKFVYKDGSEDKGNWKNCMFIGT